MRPDGEMALSANRARRKMQQYRCRVRKLSALRADPDNPMHGTMTGYNYGCRCERCRAARHEFYISSLALVAFAAAIGGMLAL